uniref:Uncharacterized protein n=1 Tax=Utricularia reniformis TaxID=192314 RepID=A0A1Y0AYX2_9LAMI|nr:hypothetical protein AEK19_MT1150 [Utricularia reniformis]ART30353.1 hypothetical protein AEK19_MT1150 [Utricularia reniformis]
MNPKGGQPSLELELLPLSLIRSYGNCLRLRGVTRKKRSYSWWEGKRASCVRLQSTYFHSPPPCLYVKLKPFSSILGFQFCFKVFILTCDLTRKALVQSSLPFSDSSCPFLWYRAGNVLFFLFPSPVLRPLDVCM